VSPNEAMGNGRLVGPDEAGVDGRAAGCAVGVDGPAAGVDRSAAGWAAERRQLSFRASGLVIELEITGSGESRQLTGRLIPAQSGVVEIRGVICVEADGQGRFTADAVPAGQVSVRCRLGTEAERARVATGWVAL
jgi:hypothetical protein